VWLSNGKGFILSTWTVRAEWTPVSCLGDSKGFSKAIIEGWWRKGINAPFAFTGVDSSENQVILGIFLVSTKGGVVQDGQAEKV